MTSEQLLDLLAYLPDDAILRADPEHFRIRKKTNLRKILTFGGLTAALVLCFTVGLTRFFSPTPGGSPSVQLPPVVATDTQTATTDTENFIGADTSIQTMGSPHIHYQGNYYMIDRYDPYGVTVVPDGYRFLGYIDFRVECITEPCQIKFEGDMSLFGPQADSITAFLSPDGTSIYADNGRGSYFLYILVDED